jgi:hypothetical protein
MIEGRCLISRPSPSGGMLQPSVVLLDSLNVAFYHSVRLRMQGRCARLADSQTLQNFLKEMRLEVTALVSMQFSRLHHAYVEQGGNADVLGYLLCLPCSPRS